MNTQRKIKSRCQELLKEQEMSRRKIRELISRAVFMMEDPTRCLEPWDWTFSKGDFTDEWARIFTLPCPLLVERDEQFYPQQKVIIVLQFTDYYIDLWVKPYPEFESTYYLYYLHSCCDVRKLNLNRMSLIFQRTAIELPKVISSVRTESFYDETKRELVEVILVSELAAEISQLFEEVCKTLGAKLL